MCFLKSIILSYTDINLGEALFNSSTNSLSFPLNYTSDEPIYGFQFTITFNDQDLTLNQIYGGDIYNDENNFSTSLSTNTGNVLSYSETQDFIYPGSGILLNILFEINIFGNSDTICIENPIFAGTPGSTIEINQQICSNYILEEEIIPEIIIVSPDNLSTIIDYTIPITIESLNLTDQDNINVYINSQIYNTYQSAETLDLIIAPIPSTQTGNINIEAKAINSEGQEYNQEASSDSIQINFAIPGDYNLDGNVNVADIVLIVKYILGIENASALQEYASDFDNNNSINVSDVVLIVNYILS
ncbi:MAG: hypothetical protein CMG00_01350 [Candidatus Marinimicrobia bacterium]|nr:hypothetical protein [Candidatus Neomarinimicrobiota bacterium]